jgi:hypothetical protein
MAVRTEFVPYRPKTILNKHKRTDLWFWKRYMAYPYKGCQYRCFFFGTQRHVRNRSRTIHCDAVDGVE